MSRLRGKTITEREAYLIELATLDERDRIIALLDSIGFHSTYLDDGSHTEDCDGCELVALIKGEKK